jgi:hypothetical protein
MMTSILLRIASVTALLQGVAHTAMFVSATPRHGARELAVVEAMKMQRFDFLGSLRSYWDFYFGYGLFAAFNCFIEAVLFWQLARIAATHPSLVRPIVALFCVANVGYACLAGMYFFVTPIVPDVVLAVCLALAFFAPQVRNGVTTSDNMPAAVVTSVGR